MGPIGIPEMLFILAIALLIFGPRRLPEFGRTIGKALGEFRRATTDLKRSIDVEMTMAEADMPEPTTRASSAAADAANAAPVARESEGDDAGGEEAAQEQAGEDESQDESQGESQDESQDEAQDESRGEAEDDS